MTAFATIIADPAWPYGDKMLKMVSTGSGAAAQYRTLSLEDIIAIGAIPGYLVLGGRQFHLATNAHLWCWATNGFVEIAHGVCRAWGFTPKTVVIWVKGRIDQGAVVHHIGQGRYLRNSTEHVIFATRGRAPARIHNLPTAFIHPARWPGRLHSEKPPIIHQWAELMGCGPRLELFARRTREGWEGVGDEL